MRTAWADRGVNDASVLEAVGRAALGDDSGVAVDYLAVADPERLAPVATVAADSVALVAARVGRTRLIDNIDLGPPRRTGRA
jgi:pantoate--beta-alanine ligase